MYILNSQQGKCLYLNIVTLRGTKDKLINYFYLYFQQKVVSAITILITPPRGVNQITIEKHLLLIIVS